MNIANRHVVDRLFDLRAEIKALQAEEKKLTAEVGKLMGADDSAGGDDCIATQSITERKGGVDEKKAKAAGFDVDKFRKPPTPVVTIRVNLRVADEEAA